MVRKMNKYRMYDFHGIAMLLCCPHCSTVPDFNTRKFAWVHDIYPDQFPLVECKANTFWRTLVIDCEQESYGNLSIDPERIGQRPMVERK